MLERESIVHDLKDEEKEDEEEAKRRGRNFPQAFEVERLSRSNRG